MFPILLLIYINGIFSQNEEKLPNIIYMSLVNN